jgi:hypothetical protein
MLIAERPGGSSFRPDMEYVHVQGIPLPVGMMEKLGERSDVVVSC